MCAYLGQLAKVRDALSSEVAVVIDDRDQVALADQESDKEDVLEMDSGVERVQVSKRVRSFVYFIHWYFFNLMVPRFVFEPWITTKAKKPKSVLHEAEQKTSDTLLDCDFIFGQKLWGPG